MTKSIKSIKMEDFIKFKKTFFKTIYIKSFAIGTIEKNDTEEQMKKIILTLNEYYKSNKANSHKNHNVFTQNKDNLQMFANLKTSAISSNFENFVFQKQNFYKNSPDASTLNAFFIGENNLENYINMRIVGKIAGNIFFSNLRIKEQLGYAIKNRILNVENNLVNIIHIIII